MSDTSTFKCPHCGDDIELMGSREAALELGVQVSNLGKVRGIPEPVARVRSGPFYLALAIRDFKRNRPAREDARVGGRGGARHGTPQPR